MAPAAGAPAALSTTPSIARVRGVPACPTTGGCICAELHTASPNQTAASARYLTATRTPNPSLRLARQARLNASFLPLLLRPLPLPPLRPRRTRNPRRLLLPRLPIRVQRD